MGNWADKTWFDFDPTRRTSENLFPYDNNPDLRQIAIDQVSAPSAWTLDFFGGKSWKIGKNFLYLNVSVSNILNKQFVNSGYEIYGANSVQVLDAVDQTTNLANLGFPNKVQYNPGTTYFAGLSWRF